MELLQKSLLGVLPSGVTFPLGVLCLQLWDEDHVQILSSAQNCHHLCDNRALCSRQNTSSWWSGFNTFAGMLLKPARAVARGLLFYWCQQSSVPCDRSDAGLSQLEHVFLLDSFLSTRVPHLLPCAAPWCCLGNVVQRRNRERWSSRHCANQYQHQRRFWTALSFSFCSEWIFFVFVVLGWVKEHCCRSWMEQHHL